MSRPTVEQVRVVRQEVDCREKQSENCCSEDSRVSRYSTRNPLRISEELNDWQVKSKTAGFKLPMFMQGGNTQPEHYSSFKHLILIRPAQ